MRLDILTEIFLPDTNGGALRVFQLAENCTKRAEVRVITKSVLLNYKRSAPLFEKRDRLRVYREKTYPNPLSLLLNYLLHIELSTFFAYYFSLRKSYKKTRPDVLYIRQSFALQLAAILLKKEFTIPIFFEIHRFSSKSDFNLKSVSGLLYLVYYALEKYLATKADGFIAISNANKAELVCEGLPEEKVVVVPNGVDVSIFHPRNGKKQDGPILLYFGFMRANEGVDTLIKAMSFLTDKLSNVKLVILGSGNVITSNKQLAESLNLQNHIDFLGEVPLKELIFWLSSADLFVYPRKNLPYHANFMGLKVLEALATGTPVITADIGILADFVKRHKCGLLFEVDNPSALADAICVALSDETTLKQLSKNAVECTKDMSWEKSSRLLLNACERLI